MLKKRIGLVLFLWLALVGAPSIRGDEQFQPPRFGQSTVGDDYFLANYTQLQECWTALAKTSNRMKIAALVVRHNRIVGAG
jgi:hypothetical protein